MAGERERRLSVLGLAAALVVVGWTQLDRYNVTWDEALGDMFFGQRYLSFFTSFDAAYLDFDSHPYDEDQLPDLRSSPFRSRPWEYYPFTNTLAAATATVLDRAGLVADWFDGFHAVNLLFGALLVAVWLPFLARHVGEAEAFAGTLLLLSMPRVVVHLLANTKDFPEMVLYVAAVVAFFEAWRGARLGAVVATGLVAGAALATKANALFLAPQLLLLVLWALPPEPLRGRLGRVLLAGAGAGVVACGVVLVSWPYLWADPLGRLGRHLSYIAGQVGQVREESLLSPLEAVVFTTPLPVLALALLGAVVAAPRAWRRDPVAVLAFSWIAVSFGRTLLPGAVNFDGVRHFLELLPALSLLAAVGWGAALRWLRSALEARRPQWVARPGRMRSVAAVALLAAVLPGAWSTVRIHPHQLAYWNALAGGTRGAFARGLPQAGDYWGLSYRQGFEWLNEHAPQGSFLAVPVIQHAAVLVSGERLRRDLGILHLTLPTRPEIPQQAVDRLRALAQERVVYVMFVIREDWTNLLIEDCRRRLEPLAQWQADGAPILEIYRYR